MLVKIGPRLNSKRSSTAEYIEMPSTSLGSMSLVNCTRRNSQSMVRASACASVVLPTPGTPSISRVSAGEDGDQRQPDHIVVATDDGAQCALQFGCALERGSGAGDLRKPYCAIAAIVLQEGVTNVTSPASDFGRQTPNVMPQR